MSRVRLTLKALRAASQRAARARAAREAAKKTSGYIIKNATRANPSGLDGTNRYTQAVNKELGKRAAQGKYSNVEWTKMRKAFTNTHQATGGVGLGSTPTTTHQIRTKATNRPSTVRSSQPKGKKPTLRDKQVTPNRAATRSNVTRNRSAAQPTVSRNKAPTSAQPTASRSQTPAATPSSTRKILPGVTPQRNNPSKGRAAFPPAKSQLGLDQQGRVVKSPSTEATRKAQRARTTQKPQYTASNPTGLSAGNTMRRVVKPYLDAAKREGLNVIEHWKSQRKEAVKQLQSNLGPKAGGRPYDRFGEDWYGTRRKKINTPSKSGVIKSTPSRQVNQGVRSQNAVPAPKRPTPTASTPKYPKAQMQRLANGEWVDMNSAEGIKRAKQHNDAVRKYLNKGY